MNVTTLTCRPHGLVPLVRCCSWDSSQLVLNQYQGTILRPDPSSHLLTIRRSTYLHRLIITSMRSMRLKSSALQVHRSRSKDLATLLCPLQPLVSALDSLLFPRSGRARLALVLSSPSSLIQIPCVHGPIQSPYNSSVLR